MKPKFYLGQQIVVKNSVNGDSVGRIESAQIISNNWRYGVKFGDQSDDGVTFISETEISYKLVGNEWVNTQTVNRVL